MAPTDKFSELTLADLSLEPLPDPGLMNFQPPKPVVAEKASDPKVALPRPSKSQDRRVGKERRMTLRFEADRRSGKDRRPRKGFEPGKIT